MDGYRKAILKLPKPKFSSLKNENNTSYLIGSYWELNSVIPVMCLARYMCLHGRYEFWTTYIHQAHWENASRDSTKTSLQGCLGTKWVKYLLQAECKKSHIHSISALKRIINIFLVSCPKPCELWMPIAAALVTPAQSWLLSALGTGVRWARYDAYLCFLGERSSKLPSNSPLG